MSQEKLQQVAEAYDMTVKQYQDYRNRRELQMGAVDYDWIREVLDEEAGKMLAERKKV